MSKSRDEQFKNLLNAHIEVLQEAVENGETYKARSEANIISGIITHWRDEQ